MSETDSYDVFLKLCEVIKRGGSLSLMGAYAAKLRDKMQEEMQNKEDAYRMLIDRELKSLNVPFNIDEHLRSFEDLDYREQIRRARWTRLEEMAKKRARSIASENQSEPVMHIPV